jgi:hypothetical protein
MGPETGPARSEPGGAATSHTIKGRWLAIALVVFILVVAGLGYWVLLSNYKGSMFHF